MGLIKTAMMTGGGIYAVKQLAKTAERRHDNQPRNDNSQGSRGNSYPNQYWGSPGPQRPPPSRIYLDQRQYNQGSEERYGDYIDQRRACNPGNGNGYGGYNEQMTAYPEQGYRYQQQGRTADEPPSYQQQGHYITGQQIQNGDNGRGQSGAGALAGMALEFAGAGNGLGKKDRNVDKAAQMASQFFSK